MQGATSNVLNLKNGWVRKQLSRKMKRSNKVMPMEKQVEIHRWSAKILTPDNGFRILFTPALRNPKNNSYEMEIIENTNPIEKITDPQLHKEILDYFKAAKAAGFYPSDFELYQQRDGRVALLDFDKYGTIRGGDVVFPFRGSLPLHHQPTEAVYTEELTRQLQNIMKGGRHRKTRRKRQI